MPKFGEYALQGFFKAKQERQDQSQFNQKLAMDTRQNGLLNDIRRAQLAISQRRLALEEQNNKNIEVEEGDPYNTEGVPAGSYPVPIFDNYLDLIRAKTQSNKPQASLLRTGKENGQSVDVYGYKTDGREVITNVKRQNLSSGNDGLTAYQKQQREDKKISRIEQNSLTADALIAAHQGGTIEIEGKAGNKRKVYQVGEQIVDPKIWKPKAMGAVNSLIRDYGLEKTKNKLVGGLKSAVRKQGGNFDKLEPKQKRDYLKKVLNNNKDIPVDEKKVLYQWVEVYTR